MRDTTAPTTVIDAVSGDPALRPSPDRELLRYVGRHGAVSIAHVMTAADLGKAAAYRRVARLIDAGLLKRLDLLRGEPALLCATRAGLRYAGLGMAPAVVSPGSVDHWLRCATVGLRLEARHGTHRILTERELLVAERHEERPIASAKVGELPDGRPRLHRPDLVILPEAHPLIRGRSLDVQQGASGSAAHPRTRERGGEIASREERALAEAGEVVRSSLTAHPRTRTPRIQTDEVVPTFAAHGRTREQAREIAGDDERAPAGAEDMGAGVIAVEVELTPKSPKRLRQIIRSWRRASWVAEVHYLCEPGQTWRAVERAVTKLHAQDRIRIGAVPPARSEEERSPSRCSA